MKKSFTLFLLFVFILISGEEGIKTKMNFLQKKFQGYKIQKLHMPDIYTISKNDTFYYAIFSDSYSKVRGYGGPISIILFISRDLKTLNFILIFKHNETPYFMKRVIEEHFLDYFKNVPINKLLKFTKIDAVSGCTYTSKGIFETVKETLFKIIKNKKLKKKLILQE